MRRRAIVGDCCTSQPLGGATAPPPSVVREAPPCVSTLQAFGRAAAPALRCIGCRRPGAPARPPISANPAHRKGC